MLCVIPFCAKDADRALDLLEWCVQLGRQNHPCLLVCDAATPWPKVMEASKLAEQAFASARAIAPEAPVEGWIAGSVALFKLAAQAAKDLGMPWFWLEPDAAPLKADWLDKLESGYQRCGSRFMGALVSHQQPGLPSPYLEGVAVYPANAIDLMATHWKNDTSWVFACAPVVVPNAFNSPLIHQLWGERGNPPVFAPVAVPGTRVFSLNRIKPEAVVFHRCKDGSLIRMLRQRRGIMAGPPSPRVAPSRMMRVVSLRRAGDIVALLPLLQHFCRKGRGVQCVVHTDFLSLFDGLSDVRPLEWKGAWEQPILAARQFKAINCQVFGQGVPRPSPGANFVTEAWRKLNVAWNRYLPLNFDRRDSGREEALASRVFKTDKPRVLVKLQGFSSPFPHSEFVVSSLRREFGELAELVLLDEVRADRLYDLLGLMDRADCLISADTVTLHLNRSHKIPTVAFINGSAWGSSPTVGNVVRRVSYKDVQAQWASVAEGVRLCLQRPTLDGIALAYSQWEPRDADTRRRMQSAFATWPRLGARLVPYGQEGRSSAQMGDAHAMPYFHDMVRKAMGTGPEPIIAVSNNDVSFDEDLRVAVMESCREFGCYWAYRLDKPGGETDQGVDFVAFTRQWWELHRHLFPDFLLGYCWWDDLMARLMQWSGRDEADRLYYHEPHAWAMHTRPNTAGGAYNERLAMEWLGKHGESHAKPADVLKAL